MLNDEDLEFQNLPAKDQAQQLPSFIAPMGEPAEVPGFQGSLIPDVGDIPIIQANAGANNLPKTSVISGASQPDPKLGSRPNPFDVYVGRLVGPNGKIAPLPKKDPKTATKNKPDVKKTYTRVKREQVASGVWTAAKSAGPKMINAYLAYANNPILKGRAETFKQENLEKGVTGKADEGKCLMIHLATISNAIV